MMIDDDVKQNSCKTAKKRCQRHNGPKCSHHVTCNSQVQPSKAHCSPSQPITAQYSPIQHSAVHYSPPPPVKVKVYHHAYTSLHCPDSLLHRSTLVLYIEVMSVNFTDQDFQIHPALIEGTKKTIIGPESNKILQLPKPA